MGQDGKYCITASFKFRPLLQSLPYSDIFEQSSPFWITENQERELVGHSRALTVLSSVKVNVGIAVGNFRHVSEI